MLVQLFSSTRACAARLIIPYTEFQRETIGIVSMVPMHCMVIQASLHPLRWNDDRRQEAWFVVCEFIKFMYPEELTEYADVQFLANADDIMHENAERIEELVYYHYGEDAEVQLRCVEAFLANHFTWWLPNEPPPLPIDIRIEQAKFMWDEFCREHIRNDLRGYRTWFDRR